MTSGAKVVDLRYTVTTDCGTGLAGSYYSRNWSGQNYPPVHPTYTEVEAVRFHRHVRKGVVYYEPKLYHYLRKDKPPSRSTTEEHPYTTDWLKYSDPEGLRWKSNAIDPWKTGTCSSCFGMSDTFVNPWYSFQELALLGRLRERVAGSTFDAGVFLGEGHQALKMIANAATTISGALAAARKGDYSRAQRIIDRYYPENKTRKAKRNTKEFAGSWLELQYGWLPILQDAHDGAVFLAHQLEVPLQHVVRARYKTGHALGSVGAAFRLTYSVRENRTKGQIKAILREVNVPALAGLTDPASVAWELLPYSFVADWFIPIGNYLKARGLAQALTGTFVKTVTWKSKISGITGDALYPSWSVSSPGFYRERGTCTREVSTSLSVPLPEIKPLGDVPSWKRAANAVSLLIQRVL